MITAVGMAKRAGISDKKFRKALRKSLAEGAVDLRWHDRLYKRWEAQENSAEHRSMERVLREIL